MTETRPLGEAARRLLEEYVDQTRRILGENLVGVYLHGSAAMGCFNPAKSDLDLIVVVADAVKDAVKRAYMDMVVALNARGPAKGIEMSVVTRQSCRPFIYPTPFELHFSPMHLKWYRDDPDGYIRDMNGVDTDLAAHFTILRRRGICLWGAPIDAVFAEVPRRDYMDSIFDDVSGAREEIAGNTMYLALNLARVLAFARDGLVLSKAEGGEWALQRLPETYRPLIDSALREYRDGAAVEYDAALAADYAGYMLGQIAAICGNDR